MALQLCSESSGWAFSPRISFSHDLSQNDRASSTVHREDSSLLLHSSPNSDFDFCIFDKCGQEPSSADELFSNGKILPRQIKKAALPPLPNPKPAPDQKKESLKQIMAASEDQEEGQEEEKRASRSFWRFTRSSSLNCANGSKATLMCSLPGLYRSNSTGSNSNSSSNPNRKRPTSKENKFSHKPSSIPSSLNPRPYSVLPKPPPSKKNDGGRTTTKKTHYSSYSTGVRISPVLNVPPPYIAKGTSNLFNFGYFLCRKEKNKRNPFPP